MGLFEQANEAALLAAGQLPQWTTQETWDGPPTGPSSGNALPDSTIQTAIFVSLRQNAAFRTVHVTVTTTDLTATYSATIDGNTVSYDANAEGATSAQDILDGLADAINAGATNATVTASTTTGLLTLEGIGVDDYDASFTAGGTGVLGVEADPATATVRVWLLAGGAEALRPAQWVAPAGGIYAIDRTGLTERLNVAGYSRLYLELDDVLGPAGDGVSTEPVAAGVSIGPCVVTG